MLSVYDQGPPPPCPAPFNLTDYVLSAGLESPDKIALAVLSAAKAQRWSYARLRAAVLGAATGLQQAGLSEGDRLLLRVGNDVAFPVAFLGAIAAGIVPVPTSAQLTESEVAALIPPVSPAAILHQDGVPCPDTTLPVIPAAQVAAWSKLPPADPVKGDPDRLAYIVFTSGTSGRPRAVAHAHRAIWARRMMFEDWYGLRASDRVLHAGAFNWTFTLGTGLLDPWTMGATALIPSAKTPLAQLPLLLKRHEATLFAAAPGVYRKLLSGGLPALPALRHGLSAGEKLAEPLRAAWEEATATKIYEAFGMSECSTFLSAAPGRDVPAGALGRPQTGRRVAVLGEDDTPVAMGEAGIIAVHRDDPGLMLGYLGQEPLSGTWFPTGDRGRMAPDFSLSYLGRSDDVMTAGGYRVAPQEVEAALATFPGIAEVAVTEVEVKPGTRIIAAFYEADAPQDPIALIAHAEAHLARYKQPRHYQHIPALPRGPNGKLARKALQALFVRSALAKPGGTG